MAFSVRYELNFYMFDEFSVCFSLGQVFLLLLHSSAVGIIPPMIRTHLHLKTSLCRRTSGRSVGIFKQSSGVSDVWECLIRVLQLFRVAERPAVGILTKL